MNSETELLVLPDGRVLIHNLTPAMAALLSDIAPDDEVMRRRATTSRGFRAGYVCGQMLPEKLSPEPNHP